MLPAYGFPILPAANVAARSCLKLPPAIYPGFDFDFITTMSIDLSCPPGSRDRSRRNGPTRKTEMSLQRPAKQR